MRRFCRHASSKLALQLLGLWLILRLLTLLGNRRRHWRLRLNVIHFLVFLSKNLKNIATDNVYPLPDIKIQEINRFAIICRASPRMLLA